MKVLITRSPGYHDTSDVFPFVKTLLTYCERAGVATTDTPETGESIALGIQWVPGLEVVQSIKRRGVPFVHRLDGRARALVKAYEMDDENREINRISDWTVFQSKYVAEHTTRPCETIFGLEPPVCERPDRASIIYNGVDRSVFNHLGDTEELEGEIRILHIAFSAGTRKGVSDLVQCADLLRHNRKIRFYTIGRQDQDLTHGRKLGHLPNVTHLGVIVDRERLARLMRSAHLLFFPSRNDYCPNTVLEAMSCGLPVWYHPSGGTPELIAFEELTAGVPMMAHNPVYPLHALLESRNELSCAAVEIVKRRFTIEHMGAAYIELFERVSRQEHQQFESHPAVRRGR